ncbi:carbonic anhydrase [Thermodesulfobacteriota bacterium]
MKFFTAINCMDGRVQLPVIYYLQERFGAEYVDVISEPGPNRILAQKTDLDLIESIFNRIEISVNQHHSRGIAVVGHHDCAGNPASKADQIGHIRDAMKIVRKRYLEISIIGLWVDDNWVVSEIQQERSG